MANIVSQDANVQQQIMHLLTSKVRLLSAVQVARTWYLGRTRPATAALRTLAQSRSVALRSACLPPELPLVAPVCVWSPGDQPPEFGRVARVLNARWNGAPRRTLLAVATQQGRNRAGGMLHHRPLRPQEIRHDLHVTALYLKFVQETPQRASEWIHEDLFLEAGLAPSDRIPDAMTGEIAVDFGGAYKKPKLLAIHRAMEREGQAYEIW